MSMHFEYLEIQWKKVFIIFLFLLKPPKINSLHQTILIYHISLKIKIIAKVTFYNCNCSNLTINNGATKSSHIYIYHDLDSC